MVYLFPDFKQWWHGMTDPATDMWVKAGAAGFFAGGCDLDPRLETSH
jgi:hypothetical protein